MPHRSRRASSCLWRVAVVRRSVQQTMRCPMWWVSIQVATASQAGRWESAHVPYVVELLSDPAHLAVEVTLMVVVDGLMLGLCWPAIRKLIELRVRRTHREVDPQCGVATEIERC